MQTYSNTQDLLAEIEKYFTADCVQRKITKEEFAEEYKKKVAMFMKLSLPSHEHNIFTDDHQSTLTKYGFYQLGHELRRITSTFDEPVTLIEVGAGTGAGVVPIIKGLYNMQLEPFITYNFNDSENKMKINKYIYTDPFNELKTFRSPDPSFHLQKKKIDLHGVINGIKNDVTIKNAILLVVCPPPIHNDRELPWGAEKQADKLVSTDVMALVESASCDKIRHVMIVRYDTGLRSDLDGTYLFHKRYVPLIDEFYGWQLNPSRLIDQYSSDCDDYYRVLYWFTRK